MSIETLLAARTVEVADDIYVVELYVPSSDPPYHDDADLPTFEGGVVGSATGETVTLSLARRAIDPDDRTDDYRQNLGSTGDQIGRWMIVRTGTLAGNVYLITGSGSDTITCDGHDLSSLSSGDVVVIADRVRVGSIRCNRDIDSLSAGFNATLDWDGDPNSARMVRSASWIYWRQLWSGNGETDSWRDVGWFQIASPPRALNPDPDLSMTGNDILRQLSIQPWTGAFQPDVIEAHQRATDTAGARCVVLKVVDESSDDDGMYRFFDSPESTEALVLVNHTSSWCVLPPPVIYASADDNDTISAGDRLIPAGQGIDLKYGTGEVRVQAKTWNDLVDEGFAYVKAQYSRYATYLDQTAGTSTDVTTTTLTDTTRSGALAWPTLGVGLDGMTLRITSGLARGKTFTIASNTANSITATESLTDAGVATGDDYEVHAINDPRRIVEDLLLATDFQCRDADRALYVAELDEVLVPGYAEQVLYYNGSTYTDLSDEVQDETSSDDTLANSGDILYVGHPNRYLIPKLWLTTPWTSGAVVIEYWNGSTWTTGELTGFVDGTSELTQTGAVHLPLLNDWRPTTVNGGAAAYFLRWRCTSAPSNALGLSAIEILGRPSAPPPSEAEWMEAQDEDDRKPADVLQQLRSNGLIPPNWILYVDRQGVVQGKEIVQAETADWTFDVKFRAEDLPDENAIRTGVLVRGQSYNTDNIAVRDTGVTIEQSTELQAKITAGSVVVGTSNDHSEHSLYGIISNVDLREHESIANGQLAGVPSDWETPDTSGPQLRLRWGYATSENASHQRSLDNTPLWIVDLGQAYADISEVAIVIDNGAHPWMNRAQTHAGDKPIFALEVSTDKSTWLPLCDAAAATAIREQGKLSEYIFSDGDSRFQRSWRYLRKKCVIGGWITQGRTAGQVRESGQVVVLKIRRSGELQRTLWLGEEAPFTADAYTNMRRRYRRRLAIDGVVDPSADTDDKVLARARKRLREWLAASNDRTLDGIRPDADLFDSVEVTQTEFGITAENHLITSLTIDGGGQCSAVMRNYRIAS